MKFLAILLSFLFNLKTFANVQESHTLLPYLPIRKHLVDATKLNQKRAFRYAKLTESKSLPLSYELILMERLALLATHRLDVSAQKYLKNGIPLFHEELIDMKFTPAFSSSFPANESPTERIEIEVNMLIKRWLELLESGQVELIYSDAKELLEQGKLAPINQNCLTRHFVESIARTIWLMDRHYTDSLKLGLKDPRPLSLKFTKLQIRSLKWAYSLDKRAYPLQHKYRVPLFCQDVPVIPYQ